MALPMPKTKEEIDAFRKFEKDLQEEELQDMTPAQRKAAEKLRRADMSDTRLVELAKETPTMDNSQLLKALACIHRAIHNGHAVDVESRALLGHYLDTMRTAAGAGGGR